MVDEAALKASLCLPATAFPMRAALAAREPGFLATWAEEGLNARLAAQVPGRPVFFLQDGPPYANGPLHHGHVLNKLLKDFVLRDQRMRGRSAVLVPGWDCHGLPIEAQVDKLAGADRASRSHEAHLAACRAYASSQVDGQRASFRRLGVAARWEAPTLTMSPAYQAHIAGELAALMDTGWVYRGLRPVHWCCHHGTALAEAEVAYQEARSPSAFVALTAVGAGLAALGLPPETRLLVWTTTPWTLPANRAVAANAALDYVRVDLAGRPTLLARARLEAVAEALGTGPLTPLGPVLPGAALAGLTYQHPFLPRTGEVAVAAHVSDDAGTGLVHTAPGHGAEDFVLGQALGLPLHGAVGDDGRLDASAGPFAGLGVRAAEGPILAALAASGHLLGDPAARVGHRTAHCWRCHQPLITRTTSQWFLALDRPGPAGGETLRTQVLAAIEQVRWTPGWGRERIATMVRQRPDWCLSRQRRWGVPIVALHCGGCGEVRASAAATRRVAERFAREGVEAWWRQPIEVLLGPQAACAACGAERWRKGTDILDVWFDSGVAYAWAPGGAAAAVPVADLVLEGSDQHRGWFQSALWLSVATRRRAPFAQVVTHGYVVDRQGKKLSKSAGNAADPMAMVAQDGAELLRVWAASEDFRDDCRLNPKTWSVLRDTYRKVRNTLRFLLGGLADFTAADAVGWEGLAELDRLALAMARRAGLEAQAAMARLEFHRAMAVLMDLMQQELSAFYLDVIKDRLYASAPAGAPRRSAQTALWLLVRDLCRLLAPVYAFTADEAWRLAPRPPGEEGSVHLAAYPEVGHEEVPWRGLLAGEASTLLARWAPVLELRRQVNLAIEGARQAGRLGNSTEATVRLCQQPGARGALAAFTPAALAEALIVAEVVWADGGPALAVEVARTAWDRCRRCWQRRAEVAQDTQAVCPRCRTVLVGLNLIGEGPAVGARGPEERV